MLFTNQSHLQFPKLLKGTSLHLSRTAAEQKFPTQCRFMNFDTTQKTLTINSKAELGGKQGNSRQQPYALCDCSQAQLVTATENRNKIETKLDMN